MNSSLIYLAGPYSHIDPLVRAERAIAITRAAVKLISEGKHVFSPITESHQYSMYGVSGGWEFWKEHDLLMLSKCDELYILTLPGWRESVGVTAEMAEALRTGKTVTLLDEHFMD